MREKGFTLVELLAVIIVIGLLATIALPQVLNQFSNRVEELTQDEIRLIEQGVGTHAMENGKLYKGKITCKTIKELVDDEVIDSNLAKNAEIEQSGVLVNYLGTEPLVTVEKQRGICQAISSTYDYVVAAGEKYKNNISCISLEKVVSSEIAQSINPNYTEDKSCVRVNYCKNIPNFEYLSSYSQYLNGVMLCN